MRRVGKGLSGVKTPLFEGMLLEPQVVEEGDADENDEIVNAGDAAKGDVSAAHREVLIVAEEPSLPSPTPPTPPPQPSQDILSTSQVQPTPPQSPQIQPPSPQPQQDAGIPMNLLQDLMDTCTALTRRVEHLEFDKVAQAIKITKLKQRVKKLERRNKGMMITDMDADVDGRTAESQAEIYKIDLDHANKVLCMQEDETKPAEVQEVVDVVTTAKIITEVVTAATIDHVKKKAKEDPVVKRYQVLKRKKQTEAQARKNMMVYLKNVAGFKMDYFKGMSYDDIRPIFESKFNTNVAFLLKTKEHIEEDENRALKRLNETLAERAARRQKLDEEVEELKRHLQIVPNEDDDVYTEATPLREDLEALWSLVKEKISTTKPKNFSDDFLLVTLGAMFEKPDIHAQILKNQRSVHGPAKVKGWKLLESCGVHIITFTTTHLFLLVERKYPLTRFTLD
nr:hypothetical protein [Tanacetum cinerariifolium]